jgi:hypothetical protein
MTGKTKTNKKINLNSVITCPVCGFSKEETMPIMAYQLIYECANCGEILSPKEDNCCVFCSFGDMKCPAVQERGNIDFFR